MKNAAELVKNTLILFVRLKSRLALKIRQSEKLLPLCTFSVLFCSCVEPFSIHSIEFESAIVVEGRLTDEAGAHYVKLNYVRPVDEDENEPLTGATVWVEGADGVRIDFIESEPGYYECDSSIAGVAGKSYRLHFTTNEGNNYQSTLQELTASPPIDSIYDVYAERANNDATAMRKGIQFFVDTHGEAGAARYYRYEWEETYEVQPPYPSLYEFFPNPDTMIYRKEQVHICYVTARSTALILGTTANLTENRLSELPVRYITNETDQLRYAYSILVRQYAVSAEAYSFYRELLANNEGTGSLFDKQMGTVAGNISAVENPDETVLGFFEVAGVADKRTFVKFLDLDRRFSWPMSQYTCAEDRLVMLTEEPPKIKFDSISYLSNIGYGVHTATYGPSGLNEVILAPKHCTDCRFRGPSVKPDFWIY